MASPAKLNGIVLAAAIPQILGDNPTSSTDRDPCHSDEPCLTAHRRGRFAEGKIVFVAALALAIAASTLAELRTFAEFTVADSGE